MYKLIWYPYDKKENIYNSRKPIAGVHYYKGIGSASRSAIARGVPPEVIKRSMGIVTIKFTTPKGTRKPVLTFVATSDPLEKMGLSQDQIKSIIAWKHGIMYKMIWYPYDKKENIYNSRKPIAGVKYLKGVGSASESAIARGVPPEVIKRTMGIVEITFTTAKGKKPVLTYAPSPMVQSGRPTTKARPKARKSTKVASPSISTMR